MVVELATAAGAVLAVSAVTMGLAFGVIEAVTDDGTDSAVVAEPTRTAAAMASAADGGVPRVGTPTTVPVVAALIGGGAAGAIPVGETIGAEVGDWDECTPVVGSGVSSAARAAATDAVGFGALAEIVAGVVSVVALRGPAPTSPVEVVAVPFCAAPVGVSPPGDLVVCGAFLLRFLASGCESSPADACWA